MRTFILFLCLIPLQSFADEHKHLVTFGSNGFGWSGAVEQMETRDASAFSDVDYWMNNIGVNYGYRLDERFIIGGHLQTFNSEYRFNNGGSSKVEKEGLVFGIYALYNFSDTIANTWYTGISIAHFSEEEEVSHNVALAESKTPFEFDDEGEIYEILLGRRFSMKKWNIDHLTYAPQVGIYFKTHSKDFDDQDVKDGFGASFQPLRFDFLF
jgi:hypothetical protein